MQIRIENPLIVQSDRTMLLEVQHPLFGETRDAITPFSELIKSPEFIHTYRITPLSIWNASAVGITVEQMCMALETYAKYGVPESLLKEIKDYAGRYGLLKLEKKQEKLWLTSEDPFILMELLKYKDIRKHFGELEGEFQVEVYPHARGVLKQELIRLGYPIQDIAGYSQGTPIDITLQGVTLRDYQQQAVDSYYAGGTVHGGNGILVLPCGAGKTVIGIAAMAKFGMEALVVTTNTTSVRQWIQEIKDKTDLTAQEVGEYTGNCKEVKPITVTTYQILTYRSSKESEYVHMDLFGQRNWGLIIYDEAHLLPAPVFRMTADIQAKRRLGLTATLVREDHREEDVFSLVGPKRYDVPWKDLEKDGWIAEAQCAEVRVPLPFSIREQYVYSSERDKNRIAAENPEKNRLVQKILMRHEHDQVLIIGQYVDQLTEIASLLQVPVITGKTPQQERDRLFKAFRKKELRHLVVSKVANFAVNLPDANVALQISGAFGSRQEEAQRLGRILRPKASVNKAYFYTLVSKGSKEEVFAHHRQMFLVEQGYRYQVVEADSI
jgi:DNA excision repair protein ERCC-3